MKKQVDISLQDKPGLTERLNEHPIPTWIAQNGKNFLYIVLIFGLLTVLAYRLMNYWSSQSGQNAVIAQNDFARLPMLTGEEREATIAQLMDILDRQPELRPVYDGRLGQMLIAQGDLVGAELLVTRALQRTDGEMSPLYRNYTEATLLIAKEDYPAALAEAQDLQQNLLASTQKEGAILLPINMIRIAMLQKRLGMRQEEAATWQTWRAFVSGSRNHVATPADFQRVAALFREGKVDLNNYIEFREKALN